MRRPSAWRGQSFHRSASHFLDLIMWPANRVCDVCGVSDEHERGMVRMLVNTLLWTTIGATGFFIGWMVIVGPA